MVDESKLSFYFKDLMLISLSKSGWNGAQVAVCG